MQPPQGDFEEQVICWGVRGVELHFGQKVNGGGSSVNCRLPGFEKAFYGITNNDDLEISCQAP